MQKLLLLNNLMYFFLNQLDENSKHKNVAKMNFNSMFEVGVMCELNFLTLHAVNHYEL